MIDIKGQKFGKLTPISYESRGHKIYWKCSCACGGYAENIRTDYLRGGISTQCKSCIQESIHLKRLLSVMAEKLNDKQFICIPEFSTITERLKLTTKCVQHGEISEIFLSTLTSQNKATVICSQCSLIQSRSKSLNYFLEKASNLYSNFYDYSEAALGFIDGASKVKVICPNHGYFDISLASHVAGHKCLKCNYHMGVTEFSEKMFPKHGTKYDYSKVVYKGSHSKVEIICSKHGSFYQTPSSHYQGAGCRECAYELNLYSFVEKYQIDKESGKKPGLLYLMQVIGKGEKFLKVGITSKMNKRLNMYNRVKEYEFKVIKTWEMTNLESALVEDKILYIKKRNGMHYNPQHKFDGRFECVKYLYKEELIRMMEEEVLKQQVTKVKTDE